MTDKIQTTHGILARQLNDEIQRVMKEENVDYPTAFKTVRQERPGLIHGYLRTREGERKERREIMNRRFRAMMEKS